MDKSEQVVHHKKGNNNTNSNYNQMSYRERYKPNQINNY